VASHRCTSGVCEVQVDCGYPLTDDETCSFDEDAEEQFFCSRDNTPEHCPSFFVCKSNGEVSAGCAANAERVSAISSQVIFFLNFAISNALSFIGRLPSCGVAGHTECLEDLQGQRGPLDLRGQAVAMCLR